MQRIIIYFINTVLAVFTIHLYHFLQEISSHLDDASSLQHQEESTLPAFKTWCFIGNCTMQSYKKIIAFQVNLVYNEMSIWGHLQSHALLYNSQEGHNIHLH